VATHKRNSELDELEKELGLDLLDSPPTSGGSGIAGGGSEGEGVCLCVVCHFISEYLAMHVDGLAFVSGYPLSPLHVILVIVLDVSRIVVCSSLCALCRCDRVGAADPGARPLWHRRYFYIFIVYCARVVCCLHRVSITLVCRNVETGHMPTEIACAPTSFTIRLHTQIQNTFIYAHDAYIFHLPFFCFTGDATARHNGVIPTQWITVVFSGSVPPAQAAQILDYAVLTNCQFAGMCRVVIFNIHAIVQIDFVLVVLFPGLYFCILINFE